MDIIESPVLEIVPLGKAIAAEVRGVDLSRELDEKTFAQIEHAYNQHTVLVFRDQKLTPEQHIRFSRRFGPLEIHVLRNYLHPQHPEILRISNIQDEQGEFIGLPDGGMTWHTDTSYRIKPSCGSVLYALEIPHDEAGKPIGDTLFASTAAAYDDLPGEIKEKLAGKKAVHRYATRKKVNRKRKELTAEEYKTQTPDVFHPAIRTHAKTGRKAIYMFEGECVGIEGLAEEESLPLISSLTKHCTQEKYIYRHKWRVGDVVMWDNAASLHLAIADYKLPQRRLLHRVTIEGHGIPM